MLSGLKHEHQIPLVYCQLTQTCVLFVCLCCNTLQALLVLREALKDEIEKERSAVARLKEKLIRMQDDGDSSEESVSCCRHVYKPGHIVVS